MLSALLLAANGFFVAAEFALVASKNYRLEREAAKGRRGAKEALDGIRELSLMLAGAQLGITACTLGLGALAEPALANMFDPLLLATGLPSEATYAIAFVVSLSIVVFLHMVVGEMAPKSWAISHPERSAVILAPPFRAFTRLVRPILFALNGAANGLLRLIRVQPQDQLAHAHGPEELAILLEQSREYNTIEPTQSDLLTSILKLRSKTLVDVMEPIDKLVTVRLGDSAVEIESICKVEGKSRLVVADDAARPVGMVHVRDAIKATTAGHTASATDLMTIPLTLPGDIDLINAVAAMRDKNAQIAIVTEQDNPIGFVALEDLLEEVIGDFDDETDTTRTAA